MKHVRLVLLLLLLFSGSSAAFAMSGTHQVDAPRPSPVPTQPTFEPGSGANTSLTAPTQTPSDEQPASQPPPEEHRIPEPAERPFPQPEAQLGSPEVPSEVQKALVWPVAKTLKWAPTRVEIPDIGVDARIVGVGVTSDGAMEAPSSYDQVGWLRSGVPPGDTGRAVLAGHVDSKSDPAVFYRLRELQPGATIDVTLGVSDEVLRFEVRETAQYVESEAPLDRVFGPSDRQELVLITCAGIFDQAQGAYDERLVVYAELQQPADG